MCFLFRLSGILERLCGFFGLLSAWMVVPLILVIVYDVITRKIFFIQQAVLNSALYEIISPTMLQEAEWHERRTARTKGWVEMIAILLLAVPFCSVLLFHSVDTVYSAWQQGEGSSPLTGICIRWIIKSFLAIGAIEYAGTQSRAIQ